MKDFTKLKEYSGEDRVVDSFEITKILESSDDSGAKVFQSKFVGLDKLIGGFMQGEVIAVAGPRKHGKTLFCQSLTYKLNEQNCCPLWIQFENTAEQFYKVFCTIGVPYFFQPLKLQAHSMDWVEERLAEAIAKFGAAALFIDHLHYLLDIYRSRNVSIEIGQIVRSLKRIAVEYNIPIFLLLHLTKVPEGSEPNDTHFRDSSLIASETDTGLMIWRSNELENNQAWLKVCYSRQTGVFNKKIKLQKIGGFLKEVTDDHNSSDSENGSSAGVGL